MEYKFGIHSEKLKSTSMDAGDKHLLMSLDEQMRSFEYLDGFMCYALREKNA